MRKQSKLRFGALIRDYEASSRSLPYLRSLRAAGISGCPGHVRRMPRCVVGSGSLYLVAAGAETYEVASSALASEVSRPTADRGCRVTSSTCYPIPLTALGTALVERCTSWIAGTPSPRGPPHGVARTTATSVSSTAWTAPSRRSLCRPSRILVEALRLVAAAPFWDRGSAIDRLCKSIGLDHVYVHAHGGGSVEGNAGSNWPASTDCTVHAVRLQVMEEETTRRLHAKAFEVLCKRGRILLSGSARAYSYCVESVPVIRQYRLRQPRCRHAGTDLPGPAASGSCVRSSGAARSAQPRGALPSARRPRSS